MYQLILTDINMPEMDGLQMTKKVRQMISDHSMFSQQKQPKDKCIIYAITAINENEMEEMIRHDILDGISVKPMTLDKLSEILKLYLK